MSLTSNLTPQRIVIAACCGLLATGALYATQQEPPTTSGMEPATLILPAVAAPAPAAGALTAEALPGAAPRNVRRVVVTHDRPGQIVFSWDGPDLKVEIIDAAPSPSAKGAS